MLTNALRNDSALVCPVDGMSTEGTVPWACGRCGATLRPMPDLGAVSLRDTLDGRPHNIYRFRELLPVRGEPKIGLQTGWTPLVEAPRPWRFSERSKTA
jgi:threonine synthase